MSEYDVLPICEYDTSDIMQFLKRTFYLDEPMNKSLRLCEKSKCTELDEYCRHSLGEGFSFKAVDRDKKNIVGVIINGKQHLKEDEEHSLNKQAESCKNLKFQKILYVLAQMEEGARLWEKFSDHKHLVILKLAATDPGWRRKGIMNALLKETEIVAKKNNIQLMRMDCTSMYSSKSAKSLGFTCIYSARYVDIKRNGQPLVVPELPHVEVKVYVKTLD